MMSPDSCTSHRGSGAAGREREKEVGRREIIADRK